MKKNLYLLVSIVFTIGIVLPAIAQITTTRVIKTIAGNGLAGYYGDGGPAVAARLDSPSCLGRDGFGNIYINDQQNNCIRKINSSGIIATIAGTGVAGYNGINGGPATDAQLNQNWGIASDDAGNIYVSDQSNNIIRKINPSGIITTIGGTGTAGFLGDGGPATNAQFNHPVGIAIDKSGNVYVGDRNNFRVRRISPDGTVITVAGNGSAGFNHDTIPATDAMLSVIWGLATDASGNLYICDGDNNRVRKVNTAGIISTIAGTGVPGYTGDGTPASTATLNQPINVALSTSGDIYIADFKNNCIRKINATGKISTITGTGIAGFSGDGGPATAARLFHPIAVLPDPAGDIYVTDLDNVRIRKISDANILSFAGGRYQYLVSCENITTSLDTVLTIIDYATGTTDKWTLLSGPLHGSATSSYSAASTGNLSAPAGMIYIPTKGYIGNDTFEVAIANGIMTDTTTVYVSVDTLPYAGVITGPVRVCVGQIIKLTDSTKNGVWSTAGDASTVRRGAVTGVSAGTDIISYTVNDAHCYNAATKPVTIDPLPATGTIYAPLSLCIGITDTIQEDKGGGMWNNESICAVIDSPVVINGTYSAIITAAFQGVSIIKYTVRDSFCSAYTTVNISIDSFPDPGTITGTPTICAGAVIVLTDTVSNGVWINSNKTIASIMHTTPPTPNEASILGISVGSDTIGYSVTNTCGTSIASEMITVQSLPDMPVISINKSIFFSVPTAYTTYQWTVNGDMIPGATAATFTTPSIDTTGQYTVTVSNNYGCAISADTSVYTGCSADDISIYPNPATSVVYIEWCKKVNAQLVCIDGKKLQMIKNVNQLNIEDLPNGSYLLKIFDAKGNEIKTEHISKSPK